MPIISTNTDSGAGTNIPITSDYTSYYILATASVLSDGNDAISISQNLTGDSIVNNGTILGYVGIDGKGSDTVITNNGDIQGFGYALLLQSSFGAHISNYGFINAAQDAVVLYDYSSILDNYGSISGLYYGVATGSGANVTVSNHGIISAQVAISSYSTGFVLNNSGEVDGAVYTYAASTIHNSGTIAGNFEAGSGAITLDGVNGSIEGVVMGSSVNDSLDLSHMTVSGAISGGLGDDVITGATGNDLIYGDDVAGDTTGGNDTISAGYGDDTVYGGYGNDTLLGNQGDDILYGNQGDDYMHGGQGNDILYGG